LLTPYRQANEQLAELRRQRLELLDTSDFYDKNDTPDGYYDEDDLNTYDFSDLDENEDYHAKMLAARSETEFNKWAAYRAEKARRQNTDISGNGIGYDGAGNAYRIKSNAEIYQEWLANQGKSNSSSNSNSNYNYSNSNKGSSSGSTSSNKNNSSSSSSSSSSSVNYGKEDYGKLMLAAKTPAEFEYYAKLRKDKIDSDPTLRKLYGTSQVPLNETLKLQWLAKRN